MLMKRLLLIIHHSSASLLSVLDVISNVFLHKDVSLDFTLEGMIVAINDRVSSSFVILVKCHRMMGLRVLLLLLFL
jgi:hypothetical protein